VANTTGSHSELLSKVALLHLVFMLTTTVYQRKLHSSSSAMREGVYIAAPLPPTANPHRMSGVNPHALDNVIQDLAIKYVVS
jgi:hypothetical protein